jgi:PAS domain-containing protein
LFSGLIERALHKKSYSEKLELTNTIIENSHEAILITDAHNHIIHTNKAYSKITGYQLDEVIGKRQNFSSRVNITTTSIKKCGLS